MEIELNNEQTTPSQQQEQRKASHDLAAARLVKMCESGVASLREIDNIIATLGNFCRVGGIWTTSKG